LQRITKKLSPLSCVVLCLVLCLGLVSVAQASVIEGVRVWRAPDHTRIVLDLSGPVEHVIAPLSNPERLVLDIANVQLSAEIRRS
jgi:N-acetylmuramoyl-L-alanine amidase